MEGNPVDIQIEPKTIQKMGDIFPVDIPIEMISHTDIDGKITPLRLRYEKEGGEKVTICFCKEIRSPEGNIILLESKSYSLFVPR